MMNILLKSEDCFGTNTSMWLDGYLFAPIVVHNQPKLADISHIYVDSLYRLHTSI